MHAVLRADASHDIGTGHVMRCLTLANALGRSGAHCTFLCRPHQGNLIGYIRARGHAVYVLPEGSGTEAGPGQLAHAAWLGSSQEDDAAQCAAFLSSRAKPEWLIVDHYALDTRWEQLLRSQVHKMLVIDDLADRPHVCDILLDQTFGRVDAEYAHVTTQSTQLLCGARYAILRPEFAAQRARSLARRRRPSGLRKLLISLGGVDRDNATGKILQALAACALPSDVQITVVMGPAAPWLWEVEQLAQQLPWPVTVLAGVDNMAELMVDADFGIGAAGATTWERCCLGLPTAMVVLAENQRYAAAKLASFGAALLLDISNDLAADLHRIVERIGNDPALLVTLSEQAAQITDGAGCETIRALLHSQNFGD